MKKIVCLLVSLIIIGSFGCSRRDKASNEIVIWHWMTDREDALQTLAFRYEQETGIKVKIELYAPSDIYSQKIIAAAQARILPDIFGILDKKSVVAEFIKSDFVADLTQDFVRDDEAWKSTIFPKALAVNLFEEGNSYGIKPGIYGVPIDVTNIQMLYNKKLLKKAGIKGPIKTFDGFLEAIQALKRVGITGLVSGWGEIWMINCFASNYAFNILGQEKIMATFRGEIPYTDPDWIKVLSIFKTLQEQGALVQGIVTKANKDAEQDFALERAAFAFNGSWCVNVYHEMNPDLEYSAMLPPSITKKFPMLIWGGAGSSFIVNKASPNKHKAIAFLKWLTRKEQQIFLSRETRNLPANKKALGAIPEVLSEFAKAMDYTTHPTIWPIDEDSLVKETFGRGIQYIIIGEKTPEQVAHEVQEVKERQTEKQKRRAAR
jgi:ABC-type glycerol-3-phosphate transport system substrate-binding protein